MPLVDRVWIHCAKPKGEALLNASTASPLKPLVELRYSTAVVFPATEWNGRDLDEVLPPADSHQAWELLPPQSEELKNMGAVDVKAVVRRGMWFPSASAEQQVKEVLAEIKERGRYWLAP
jgi:hypothetical protein